MIRIGCDRQGAEVVSPLIEGIYEINNLLFLNWKVLPRSSHGMGQVRNWVPVMRVLLEQD